VADNTPLWKVYEWLCTKIIHNSHNSIDVSVEYNVSLGGKYSLEDRQVDIYYVNNKTNERIAIDCKKYKTNVDVKVVESFIGMREDLDVDKGIIISSKGFSKGAINRVASNNKIELMTLDWESAFNSVIPNLDYYNNLNDICPECTTEKSIVPGIILWDTPYGITEEDGAVSIIFTGKCLTCSHKFLYCDVCGSINKVENSKYFCDCCEREYPLNN
jgi:hypothetical protein